KDAFFRKSIPFHWLAVANLLLSYHVFRGCQESVQGKILQLFSGTDRHSPAVFRHEKGVPSSGTPPDRSVYSTPSTL
ncbi:MAG: hypothetical protein IKF65_03035, partial [Clostridia bacterium]|nr:hypothetical protein [Clostridia bacterium]